MAPPTNPKEQKLQTFHIDQGLVLYRRRKSKYWWCRTTQDGRTHRSSTKTDNRGDATKFAQKWFEQFDKVNFSYVLPNIQGQQKIVQYLDRKTQQIDSLIEKNQKKIELLKEQRTSLINQVLTEGLNSDEEHSTKGKKQKKVTPSTSTSRFRTDETVLIEKKNGINPGLVLFKWTGRQNWYARFRFRRWCEKSTGETDKDKASEIAEDWYYKTLVEIFGGAIPAVSTARKFSECADFALRSYDAKVQREKQRSGRPSERHYRKIKHLLENIILPFFKDVPIDEVSNLHWWLFKKLLFQEYLQHNSS